MGTGIVLLSPGWMPAGRHGKNAGISKELYAMMRLAETFANEGKNGFTRGEGGIFVPLDFFCRAAECSYASLQERFDYRALILKTLIRHGYDARVVLPDVPQLEESEYWKFAQVARGLGAGQIRVPIYDTSSISWIRDSIQSVGSEALVYSPPTSDVSHKLQRKRKGATTLNFLKSIGVSARKSNIGPGGSFVVGEKFAIVANNAKKRAFRELNPLGYEIFSLPPFKHFLRPMLDKNKPASKNQIFTLFDHIDMKINIVKREKLIVADESYYINNKESIDNIAFETSHKLILSPKTESNLAPSNFLELPDGAILLNKAVKTAHLLQKEGVDLIVMDKPLLISADHSMGGIRCMTTVLEVNND